MTREDEWTRHAVGLADRMGRDWQRFADSVKEVESSLRIFREALARKYVKKPDPSDPGGAPR